MSNVNSMPDFPDIEPPVNNRERKYRAWHPEKKIMAMVGTLPSTGKIQVFYESKNKPSLYNVKDNWYMDLWNPYEIIILDFIGLFDADSNAIYEGDILQIRFKDDSKAHKIVRWIEDKCAYNVCNVSDLEFVDRWDVFSQIGKKFLTDFKMYVIGNEYENPELLEISKQPAQ